MHSLFFEEAISSPTLMKFAVVTPPPCGRAAALSLLLVPQMPPFAILPSLMTSLPELPPRLTSPHPHPQQCVWDQSSLGCWLTRCGLIGATNLRPSSFSCKHRGRAQTESLINIADGRLFFLMPSRRHFEWLPLRN